MEVLSGPVMVVEEEESGPACLLLAGMTETEAPVSTRKSRPDWSLRWTNLPASTVLMRLLT